MKYLVFVVALTIMGCSTCGPTPPIIIEPDDTERCLAACERMRELGCEEGQDLEDGTTCEEFCVDTQEQGHALNPSCIETIESCDEISSRCYQ